MAKVTIKASVRKSPKDKSKVNKLNKNNPKPGKVYLKSATTKQNKAYNTFQM